MLKRALYRDHESEVRNKTMVKKKRLQDAVIIAAIIDRGSVSAAADSLGITRNTVYSRMKKPEFQRVYNQQKGEILKAATAKLQSNLTGAIDALANIMQDTETAPQTRVTAATAILQYGVRYTETADIVARIEKLENEGD